MLFLRLGVEDYNQVIAEAKAAMPLEVCGLLAGKDGLVEQVIPMKNVAPRPETQYAMDGQALLQAYQAIEARGLHCIGIYHSHPRTEAIPSQADIKAAEINTPHLAHVIISLKYPQVGVKAWQIKLGQVDDLELLIGQQESPVLAPLSRLQIWAIILATLCAVLLLLAISWTLLPAAPPIPTPH